MPRLDTQILPALLLFGLGLAMTVAPLTATVLGDADENHAGIASGVNNAVARVAGLLAVAVIPVIAGLTGWLPGAPITRQQWLLLKAGNVVSGHSPGIAELGVKPRPLGLFLERWMVRYRPHGRFGTDPRAA